MGKDKYTARGIQRIFNAVRYSWQGLCAAWRHEQAFRQEVAGTIVLIPVAVWLGDTPLHRLLLISSLLLILILELLNSAIEAVVDRFGDEQHVLAGRAKDLGSAAVMLGLINAGVIWLCILYTKFG